MASQKSDEQSDGQLGAIEVWMIWVSGVIARTWDEVYRLISDDPFPLFGNSEETDGLPLTICMNRSDEPISGILLSCENYFLERS